MTSQQRLTIGEIQRILRDGFVDVQCPACDEYTRVEPDCREESCPHCGAEEALTSPLVELNLI